MKRHLGMIPLLALTLAACGSSPTAGGTFGGTPSPTPTPAPSDDGRTPNPLNVQITLDSARTVEGTLSPAGGTLTATAADGTTFTLTAPENAVLSTLKVKMTPVQGLTGLNGMGGYLAAVHLEPEGMEFFEPLTLKITAPHALDGGKLRGFNSHQLGSGFYYQGRKVDGQTATLQLMHFSNPGVAEQDDSDLIVPIPSNPRDRLENDLAADDAVDQGLHLTNFYIRIKAELQAATGSDAALKDAIQDFLTWRAEVERLGQSDAFKAQVYQGWTLIAQGIEGAVERAHAECAVNNDLSRLRDILTWVSWVKRNPRLAPYFSGKMARFEQLARDCARFELEIDSTLATNMNDGAQQYSNTVHLLISLQPGAGSSDLLTTLEGRAPIESRQYTASIPGPCTLTYDAPQPLADADAQLELMWQGGEAAPVALNFDPGGNAASGTFDCGDAGSRHVNLPAWGTWFVPAHQDECSTLGCFRLEDWQAGAGDVFAQKTYDRNVHTETADYQEHTTFTLRHAPH